MRKRFLDYFERELDYLYGAARFIGNKYPRNAARLGLENVSPKTADPFVKQLMEGVAFLTSRLESRMDDAQVEHARRLLEMVYPGLLAPVPSCTIVSLVPKLQSFSPGPAVKAVTIEKGRKLRLDGQDAATQQGQDSINKISCSFSTTQAVELWPLTLADCNLYHAEDYRKYRDKHSSRRATHVLSFNFSLPETFQANALQMDSLPVYLKGLEAVSPAVSRTLETLMTSVKYVRVVCADVDVTVSPAPELVQMGLAAEEKLLPDDRSGNNGDELVREYFVFPDKFNFFRFAKLLPSLKNCNSPAFQILAFLEIHDSTELAQDMAQLEFKLYCTPAINLFKRNLVPLRPEVTRHEHHLITDRVHANRYEIHTITSVSARSANEKIHYQPFYSYGSNHADRRGFFSIKRVSSALQNDDVKVNQEKYSGTELYLALVDHKGFFLNADNGVSLDVNTLCTNRHLALSLDRSRTSVKLVEGSAYVNEIQIMAGPSRPIPARGNELVLWSLVGILTRNYRGVSSSGAREDDHLAYLKSIILLYSGQGVGSSAASDADRSFALGVANAIQDIQCKPGTHTLLVNGIRTIVRGLDIEVKIDAEVFPGRSVYLFGAILSHYFMRQTSINSFTRTTVRHVDGSVVKQWEPALSTRSIN